MREGLGGPVAARGLKVLGGYDDDNDDDNRDPGHLSLLAMEASAPRQQQQHQLAATKIRNLPWVEKYQPRTLNDLISHQDILSTIQKFISEDRLPHLLLYGPPGTGKTSTILACAKQLCKDKEFGSMVLELNASDDGGMILFGGQSGAMPAQGQYLRKGLS
ncbi:Hypothetical predicted protein [Marmota monax]|uniref:ATPase AAA-type core domain-containing protein n=1 Tax=Marmota monax TaxID=9995 RepID=A0A5E4CXH6_MARMO|nr:Hypothetical predicted protein [Marmota monax]